jgi:hypothetical protein
MTETFMRGHAAEAANLHFGACPFGSQARRRGFGIFVGFLRALYESRRRQAEREIRRHQHLLDRYARSPLREQSSGQVDRKVSSR